MVYKRQLFFQYSCPSGCDTSKLLSDDLKNKLYYDCFQKVLYHYSHQNISIHALREEGDPSSSPLAIASANFYPRPPRGGRRWTRARIWMLCGFLSTPSARRATREQCHLSARLPISIHALREEGDHPVRCQGHQPAGDFYPRPPRGGRQRAKFAHIANAIFLSTPSARRATFSGSCPQFWRRYFYPRPPRGGRRLSQRHAVNLAGFLSTPSARRATRPTAHIIRGYVPISIHALREEGDFCKA